MESQIWVPSGSNKPWQRVPKNTNDGLSAPLSITKFPQTATLSLKRPRFEIFPEPDFRKDNEIPLVRFAR